MKFPQMLADEKVNKNQVLQATYSTRFVSQNGIGSENIRVMNKKNRIKKAKGKIKIDELYAFSHDENIYWMEGKITTAAEWCMLTFHYQKTYPCDNLALSDKQRNAHHLMLS